MVHVSLIFIATDTGTGFGLQCLVAQAHYAPGARWGFGDR